MGGRGASRTSRRQVDQVDQGSELLLGYSLRGPLQAGSLPLLECIIGLESDPPSISCQTRPAVRINSPYTFLIERKKKMRLYDVNVSREKNTFLVFRCCLLFSIDIQM